MNYLQNFMFNEGERLVPNISHDESELIRHRSSYAFFYSVILEDIKRVNDSAAANSLTTVVDLGFGTGYGCALLSSLPATKVTGIDIEEECQTFAQQYYRRSNVDYLIEDLTTFIPNMNPYDYAVSRGVLEHVPDGLGLIGKIKFNRRVMVDVPFDEPSGNKHHVITGIKKKNFEKLKNCEIFYEDIDGNIYASDLIPDNVNMIMVVLSSPSEPKISSFIKFPILKVTSNELELLNADSLLGGIKKYYDSAADLNNDIERYIRHTDVVLDIGCGIVPMAYFRPAIHIMVEPWQEYADIISSRYSNDKSIFVLNQNGLDSLKCMAENSVDSIFLLDVIEHMTKEEGLSLLVEMERVAREQITVFTPLGFMPQHYNPGEKDAWGLSGASTQEHLSGWLPEDFPSTWNFFICKNYHFIDQNNYKSSDDASSKVYGAFYAVRNFENKTSSKPLNDINIRRPLPSEVEAQILNTKLNAANQTISCIDSEKEHLIKTLDEIYAKLKITKYGPLRRELQFHEDFKKYNKNILVRISVKLVKIVSSIF